MKMYKGLKRRAVVDVTKEQRIEKRSFLFKEDE
jgi:hypothetical protein